jgi:hypothetical protein
MDKEDRDHRLVNMIVIVLGILAILTMVAFAILGWLGSTYAGL